MPAGRRAHGIWLLPLSLALAAVAAVADAADRRAGAAVEAAGIWHCLIYGDPIYGEQRVVLWLAADGRGWLAVQASDSVLPWDLLGPWEASRRTLRFHDAERRRDFEARLDRASLGGQWRSDTAAGGWWCARRAAGEPESGPDLRASLTEFFLPPLVTSRMATPVYPREAIRAAKEGRAVACFVVDASGAVLDPEIVELSDDVFAEPTLQAARRSRYRPSSLPGFERPACRRYDYSLKVVH